MFKKTTGKIEKWPLLNSLYTSAGAEFVIVA